MRTGDWLTLPQAQRLMAAPDPETTKGLQDRVLLGLLVGCGLRRGELSGLGFADIAQREGRWAIVDLVGKHGRVRTVTMPSWAKTALDAWASAAGISTGAVLRRVDKGGRVGDGPITPQGGFEAVVSYARRAGLGRITPLDLRRTFAKLAHLGRMPLGQLQNSLGHASSQTNERYLGLRQNIHNAPCDRLGLGGWKA
ncbi:MAG: tyrosine-type recombinase/integrase [Bryobacterales bacterium]|nr:tyrosine-type recombinase/integrase [Bryobacterales bacterium]